MDYSRSNSLLCLFASHCGIFDYSLLPLDPVTQLIDLVPDAASLVVGRPGEFPLCVGKTPLQLGQKTPRLIHPPKVLSQSSQTSLEVAAEIHELPRTQTKRKLCSSIKAKGNHGLLVFQRSHPLFLAD